jgi:hypothetical protein
VLGLTFRTAAASEVFSVRTADPQDHGAHILSRLSRKVHRFCAAFRAEPRAKLTLACGCPSTAPGGPQVHSIKLRALPYIGALTFIASVAGYMGGR